MQRWYAQLACGIFALPLIAATAPAQTPSVPQQVIPFQANNPSEPGGDRLEEPRRLAAAIVAADGQPVTRITDVGSFTGEFLEAFMDRFPEAKGQWTEPVATNQGIAERRLKRFGNNASYRIGCPSRDLAQNCVPAGTQVLLTSWLSIHQDLPGIQRFYKIAYGLVPAGGWVINIDHVGAQDADWHHRLEVARATLDKEGLAARIEGPPVHHPDFRTPLLEDQIAALHAAGFTQVHVAWRRLDTVLLMARK